MHAALHSRLPGGAACGKNPVVDSDADRDASGVAKKIAPQESKAQNQATESCLAKRIEPWHVIKLADFYAIGLFQGHVGNNEVLSIYRIACPIQKLLQ